MEASSMLELLIIGLVRGGLYSLMAVGLALLMGVMNVASFVHGELYMIGAYAAWFALEVLGLNPIPSLLFGAVGSFIGGAIIDRGFFDPLRRRSEDWLTDAYLVTVGLSFVLQNAALATFGPVYRGVPSYWSGSIDIAPTVSVSVDRTVALLIAVGVIGLFWLFLRRTRIGRAIRAVSEDEIGARLVGIELDRIFTLSFGLSSMLAGVAGAALLSVIPAYPSMGSLPLIKSWLVVILAGLGNIRGAVVSGFIIGLVESASYYFLGGGWPNVVNVCILIVVLLFKPSGLFGTEVKGVLER